MKKLNLFIGIIAILLVVAPVRVQAAEQACLDKCEALGNSQAITECKKSCEPSCFDKFATNCNDTGNTCYTECSKSCPQEEANNSTTLPTKYKEPDPESPIQFCKRTAVIWQIVGWVVLVFKILVPILLIILGMVDLGKAVVGSKEDDIKKATQSLINRAIAAIVIFFIPTIVAVIMSVIADFRDSGAKADFEECKKCLLDPKDCDTSNDASKL